MVFSSNFFLFVFLPLVLILYFLLPEKIWGKKCKNYLLLIASLLFYAWGEMHYLWLLFLSILGNYFFGMAIGKAQAAEFISSSYPTSSFFHHTSSFFHPIFPFCHPELSEGSKQKNSKPIIPICFVSTYNQKKANLLIFLAVSFNLGLLCYFKYANFIVENLNLILPFKIELVKINLPIGISFFTFHAISYLVDIYRRKCVAQKNILDLALYIAFFPQLIAGPIVRYNFVEKYLTKRRHNLFFISYGIRRFIIGFAKKVLIANPLGEVADAVFASQISDLNSPFAWMGIICYTLQIYFDFSGYSDMAVGLARIFGFKFPENFNYPYIAKSIKEFWRRWHISLSAWFRDYVYIPLGGNRVSLVKQYFNLITVFFLCGLWHGASWNFIIWGLFHGFFLVIERKFENINYNKFLRIFSHFYAMLVVIIGWVFFRSPDLHYSLNFLYIMFTDFSATDISSDILRLTRSHLVWSAFVAAIIGFSPAIRNYSIKLIRKNKLFLMFFDVILIAIFIAAIIQISAATHNPFIYFQF